MADAAAPSPAEPPAAEAQLEQPQPAAAAAGAAADDDTAAAEEQRKRALEEGPTIAIKVTFGKHAVTTTRPPNSTVAELKADIAQACGWSAGDTSL